MLLLCTSLFAQNSNNQATWQQRVDYKINVTLNDSDHVLYGFETMTYYNNSPVALTEVFIHLWPNAYINTETPFARQHIENGKTDFYFAKPNERGRIDSLNFRVNGEKVKAELVLGSYEICRLSLNKPLGSHAKIEITTPFRVYIPKVFSRLGHEDQLYCITQWYPKPAVFDVNGWNTMPYLDQGEFYSEFGKFDVSITLPKEYVIAATGDLQQTEERDWWMKKINNPTEPNPAKSAFKTVRFIQDSVHDFAWFASQKFRVAKSEVRLKSGRTVDTWLFAEAKENKKEEPVKGVNYINDAITFYSDKVGEYPYNHATVVVTPLEAGGGMEYPTITNVAIANRQVIVHEVGHNWFYGILGTNERAHPWMDESINNYYESRSTYQSKIATHPSLGMALKGGSFSMDNIAGSSFGLLELQYLVSARNNTDQAATISSEEFTDLNYGTIIYSKASLAFLQLQRYLGDDVFDNMMRSYYAKWKFKHPLPNDFRQHAEAFTGKNLSWFFDGLLGSEIKPDYSIQSVKRVGDSLQVSVKNKGGIPAPFAIQTLSTDSILTERWLDGFTGTKTITLSAKSANAVAIDAREESIDAFRQNNKAKTSGLFKTSRALSFSMFGNTENPYKKQVYYAPIMGANMYNKFMLGLAFYNSILPRTKTEFTLAPMFAFGTKDVTGYFSVQRRIFTQGLVREVQVGVDMARFGTRMDKDGFIDSAGVKMIPGTINAICSYEKIAPRVRFLFHKSNPRTDADKDLTIRLVMINEQPVASGMFANFKTRNSFLDVKYNHTQNRKLNPYTFSINYQFGNAQSTFQKINAEFNAFVDYGEKKKGLNFRAFAGMFLQKPTEGKDDRVYYRVADNNGYFDYMYDEAQFGRGKNDFNTSTIFTQQLMPFGSCFRTYAPGLGETDSWLAAANLTSTIPGILPIRVFVDVAAINSKTFVTDGNTGVTTIAYQANLHYVSGLSVWMLKDVLQVNFPIFADPNTQSLWKLNNSYGQRMTFTLKLNKLNPLKSIRELNML